MNAFLAGREFLLEDGVLLVHVVLLVVDYRVAQVARLEDDDQHSQTETSQTDTRQNAKMYIEYHKNCSALDF